MMLIPKPKNSFLFIRQNLYFKLSISLLIIFLCSYFLFSQNIEKEIDARKCFSDYYINKFETKKLDDILLSERKPNPGKTIFFHETSCLKTGQFKLNARQACAIESAALLNPNLDVFVLFSSARSQFNETTLQSKYYYNIFESLSKYSNIYFRNLNLWTYAADTPIYEWLKDGQLFESKYVLSHVSDFLRYLTLWRWGGTYLDLDVIVQKTMENIKSNYAGAESDNFVAAGVLNLDIDGFGHDIAELCLQNFQTNFKGNDWGNNGPGVITRVLNNICKTTAPTLMTRNRCFGFKVYPKEIFYAVRWWNWQHFFDEKSFTKVMNLTNNSIAIHVWNKHSHNGVVKVGSKVAYGVIAETYCPKVYSSCGKYF